MAVAALQDIYARARAIAALPVADWPAAVAALDDYERGVVRAYLRGWQLGKGFGAPLPGEETP